MRKKITIKDIAEKSKLAKGTVSMALNNDPRISEETRKKVQKIALEFNYYPDESAKKLASGRTDSIAFIAPRFTSPFISIILSYVEMKAFKTGKYVHGITPYSTANEIATKEELLRKMVYGRKADAVVLFSMKPTPEIVEEYKKSQTPLILVENDMKGCHSIMVDNVNGSYKATKYLISKYGNNIGFIVGENNPPLGQEIHYASLERMKGYKKALSENLIEFDSNLVQYVRHYSYDEGRECLINFRKKNVKLDAIFCAAGDILAMGVMDQAVKEGLKIPQQLAVMGYDDIQAAKLFNPALTTVNQPFEEIGNAIFDLAVNSIEGKVKEEKHIVIDPGLVIRTSA
jgi:LacI family transcriptional regulator